MMEAKKCKHEMCTCLALPAQDFCGDSCKTAEMRHEKGKTMERCPCQHPDCMGEAEDPSEVQQGILTGSEALA